jgi:phosphoglycolate phosphatase
MPSPRPTLAELLAPRRRVVFMDCDGIIFDTNESKCDAFRFALMSYPSALVERLVAHHKATGGVSRYVKFKHFFEVMHPVPDPDAAIRDALLRFGEFSEAAYARLPVIPESLAFAARMGGPERVHVVSGSDGDELRRVFADKGLTARFGSVLGSPDTKATHLRRLLASHGAEAHESLFIGDGGGDWAAAKEIGVPFILLTAMSEWHDGPRAVATEPGPPAAVAATWAEILAAMPSPSSPSA